MEHEFPGLGHRVMMLNARQIERQKDQTPLILAVDRGYDRIPRGCC